MSEAVLYDAAGPRGRRRILVGSVAGGVLVALVVGLAVARLASNGVFEAERWQILTRQDLLELIGRGLAATLRAAALAMVLAMAVGGLLAVARLSRRRWLAAAAGTWVEVFRGLPLLLLILFLFLGLPAAGVTISTFWALVGGLTLYNSAVIGEIFRAGILSLPRGQTEAAYAVGLRRGQTLRLILIPQAVRRMLPALISQLVTLLKDTSLGFVIAYAELLRVGRNAVEFLGGRYSIPVYTAIAVVYIAVNLSLSLLARWLDRRTRRRYGRTVETSAADEAA
ncbi:MAG TPA: amino acid ABC transporter permease [Actinomycetota bacterium]|jgi:glutamate transport system permease protein|nr:amino acid ABC transporter permease [Actinomycetota bacterium]